MTLGIDLGGTNLCLGLVEDGIVKERISVPSFEPSATLDETLEYLAEQIAKVLTPQITKIGIGVPTVMRWVPMASILRMQSLSLLWP
jgi:glucokinase